MSKIVFKHFDQLVTFN